MSLMDDLQNGSEYFQLDNGLNVALQRNSNETFYGQVRVNFGRVHERPGEEGLSHFLEHCLFTSGSSKYNPLLSSQIRKQFGYANAFTSLGRTTYEVDSLREDFELWLDYVSESLFRPGFDTVRVENERRTILNELNDRKSNAALPHNTAKRHIFYRGHPIELDIGGNPDVVANADIEALKEIHGRGYSPENMDLFIAGGIPDNARALIANYFSKSSSRGNTRREFPILPPLEEAVTYHFSAPWIKNPENPESSSAEIMFSYVVPHGRHEDTYATHILARALGFGEQSRLFQRLREKEGLAYSVGTDYEADYGAGRLDVFGTVPSSEIERARKVMLDEIHKMSFIPVSDEFLSLEKKSLTYAVARTFETNKGHVNAMRLSADEGLTIPELVEKYNGVTQEDIMRVAEEHFKSPDKGKYLLSIADPLKKD